MQNWPQSKANERRITHNQDLQIYTQPFGVVFYPFLFPSLLKFITMFVLFKAKPRKKGLKTELHLRTLMGSCSDVLCCLLDRGKSVQFF